MALVFKDRVQETSSTTGTGTLTLGGAVSGYQTFSSAIGNTNTTYYAIVNDSEWEVGLGTVSAGQLSRDTVLESSNANALVNFSAGTKYVFCTYAADKTVIQDASGKVSDYAIENSTIGATTASTGRFTSVTTPSVTATTTDLTLSAISTGAVNLNTLGGLQAQVRNTASAVNYVQVTGSATTKAPIVSMQGSDTNISMAFQPKGTGAIDLAAGSSGVNISNGNTVTAITRTASGSGYATAPTVTISPPTTAGGVQATATCTVTAGAVNTTFTITNAGSGYIEQPTVSFSGGGGSGAAAYASAGSSTTIRSLGGSSDISIDTIPILHLRGKNTSGGAPTNTTAAFGMIPPQTNFGATILGCVASPYFVWAGTGTSIFQSNATSPQTSGNTGSSQFAIAHTTAAVNYVQVTGAATGGAPTIQAQGSDASVELRIVGKGNSGVALMDSAGLTAIRAVQRATSGDTFLDVQRSLGFVDLIATSGVADSDIRFTPKGTGRVRFGTYTASILAPTGYIEVKDSGGTVRRLLVG